MNEISSELGLDPQYPLMVGLEVHEPSGRLIMERHEVGHSWTRNAWNMLLAFFGDAGASGASFGAGHLTARDITGTISSDTGYCCEPDYNGDVDRGAFCNPSTNADYGIVVGTGSTAFSVNQYALAAICGHGTGSGQLNYAAMAQSTRSYASSTWTCRHSRTMANNSGAPIVVSEIGLYWQGFLFTNVNRVYMMARDVLETPVTVAAGGIILTVNYDVSLDFGAID